MLGFKKTMRIQSPFKLRWTWPLLAAVFVAGTLFYRQKSEVLVSEKKGLADSLALMQGKIERIKLSNEAYVMKDVIGELKREIEERGDTSMSLATIDRVAAMSIQMSPYLVNNDSGQHGLLSPERAELLTGLLGLGLKVETLDTLFDKASFAMADLRGYKLSGSYLAGVDLSSADLTGVDLSGADLTGANLVEATMTTCNLKEANLKKANLSRAELSYADLTEAKLMDTDFNGAVLHAAQLKGQDLRKVDIRWSTMSHAFLNGADLRDLYIQGVDLSFANLSGANFQDARWKKSNFTSAIIEGAILDKVTSVEDLPSQMKAWNPVGWDELSKRYAIEPQGERNTDFIIRAVD